MENSHNTWLLGAALHRRIEYQFPQVMVWKRYSDSLNYRTINFRTQTTLVSFELSCISPGTIDVWSSAGAVRTKRFDVAFKALITQHEKLILPKGLIDLYSALSAGTN